MSKRGANHLVDELEMPNGSMCSAGGLGGALLERRVWLRLRQRRRDECLCPEREWRPTAGCRMKTGREGSGLFCGLCHGGRRLLGGGGREC